ncbi:uncharacterized protein LOC129759895 [Uranotaenia lowii]|uniref:uncharacterized protein LOC129759895 n=1 Tax=Uranotaenia lowii TaxID=190385 RepID=UPI0024789EFF|nr:uncharacterized protein LOC129759895 [Uranotaenia lowii]
MTDELILEKSTNIFCESTEDIQKSHRKNPKLLQLNIRGMNNPDKFDSLKIFLENLKINIDVIVISETWVKEKNIAFFNLPGYKATFSSRLSNGGGLAIYVRDDIKFTIKRNTEDDGYHHIGIEILHYGESITVHGIYRPPGYNFSKFINHLEILLTEANLSKPIFILGDLNIPINRENDSVVLQYQSLLSCFSLAVSNNIVTRPASNNLLDHSIVRINDLRSIINCTFECDISDHRPVLTTYIIKKALPEVKILSRRHTNREHLEKDFVDFLRNADFRNQDPNARLNTITERYQQLLVKHTHVTTAVVRMRKICPWMTLEIWQLLKSRDKILRKWKKNPTNLNLSEQMKRMNKQLQNVKRKAKIEYYEQLMNTSNMKILWKRINEMIGKNSKPVELTLNLHGESVDSPLPVANAFNEFFTAIGQHLASQHHSTGNIDEFGTIKRIRNSIFLRPSTVREVITIISSLDPSKASGVDSFPVSALRTHHAVLAPILTSAFNDSVRMGKYPECLKLAVVHPVFKSGDPKALNSYRPISVLSAFSKINSEKYVELLKDILVPLAEDFMAESFIFQQDNAVIYVSKTSMRWFLERDITVSDWLAVQT